MNFETINVMLKVGLTGGIGSGKSTAAQIFEVLGIPVYYADDAAKNLMNTDQELRAALQEKFGEEVYKNGELDRQYLASVVFNNSEKLEQLNALVHPATIRDAERWINDQQSAYVIKEAALLFESGSAEGLDYVIGVSAPQELRVKRAMERDGADREEVMKRINNQMDEETKLKRCDFILINDETQLLMPQVLELHQKLLSLSQPSGS